MATVKLEIDVTLDIITLIGRMVLDSLGEDRAAIEAYFKLINNDYYTVLNAKHVVVTGLIYPSQIIGKQAKLTQDIYAQMYLLPRLLDITEGHINDAKKDLNTLPKFFGISKLRTANNNQNIPGVIDGLNNLIQSISNKDNFPFLESKGLDKADITKYKSIYTTIGDLFQEREDLVKSRAALVDNNHQVINEYWADIKNVCDKGKRTFKSTNPTKVENYTMSKLKAKLTRNLKLNDVHGKVTAAGAVINKVQIELIPLEAGRRRTNKTAKGGLYEIGGIVPGKYTLNATLKGYKTFTTEITINQGEKLNLDILLELA